MLRVSAVALLATLFFVPTPLAVAGTVTIDFESPALVDVDWFGADRFTDDATGVVFTGDFPRSIGLVVNEIPATSMCVAPESRDQRLATGLNDRVGQSNDDIYIYFPRPLQPPVSISVTVFSGRDTAWSIRAFHPVGLEAGLGRTNLRESVESCSGSTIGRGVVTVTSDVPVAWAVLRDAPTNGFVAVVDDLVISSPSFDVVSSEASTWSALKARFDQ